MPRSRRATGSAPSTRSTGRASRRRSSTTSRAISRSPAHDDEVVDFAVPSGNFGNICAGHVAQRMGLPIRRLILATNENDVLDEFFRTGATAPRRTAETHATSSPSMDISKASNFERFVFDLVGRDAAVVRALWRRLDDGRRLRSVRHAVLRPTWRRRDSCPARAPTPTAWRRSATWTRASAS